MMSSWVTTSRLRGPAARRELDRAGRSSYKTNIRFRFAKRGKVIVRHRLLAALVLLYFPTLGDSIGEAYLSSTGISGTHYGLSASYDGFNPLVPLSNDIGAVGGTLGLSVTGFSGTNT